MNLSKSATPSPADYMVTNFHQTDRLSQHQQAQHHQRQQQQQQLMTHHQNNIRCNENVINCRPGSGVSSSLGSSSVHSSPTMHGPSAGPPAAAAVAAAAAAAGGIHSSIFASPSVLAASAGILGHPQWLAPESSAFYSPLSAENIELWQNGSSILSTGHVGWAGYDPRSVMNPSGYPYSALSYDVRRKNATRESTTTLKAWLFEHIKNPYPTKGEKIMLAIITKMTLTQVSTWFANARRRLKKENKMQWSPRQRTGDDDDDDRNSCCSDACVDDVIDDDKEVGRSASGGLLSGCADDDGSSDIIVDAEFDENSSGCLLNLNQPHSIQSDHTGSEISPLSPEVNDLDCHNGVERKPEMNLNSSLLPSQLRVMTSSSSPRPNPTVTSGPEAGDSRTVEQAAKPKIWSLADVATSREELSSVSRAKMELLRHVGHLRGHWSVPMSVPTGFPAAAASSWIGGRRSDITYALYRQMMHYPMYATSMNGGDIQRSSQQLSPDDAHAPPPPHLLQNRLLEKLSHCFIPFVAASTSHNVTSHNMTSQDVTSRTATSNVVDVNL